MATRFTALSGGVLLVIAAFIPAHLQGRAGQNAAEQAACVAPPPAVPAPAGAPAGGAPQAQPPNPTVVAIAVALGGADRRTLVVVSGDTNPPAPGGGRQVSRTFWTLPMLTAGFLDRGK